MSTPRTNSIQRESSVSTPTPSTTPEVNSSQQQQLNSAAASEPVASTITNEVVQEVKAVASRLEPYRYLLYICIDDSVAVFSNKSTMLTSGRLMMVQLPNKNS